MTEKVYIIGLGGIGAILSEHILKYVNYFEGENRPKEIILVDGDKFEDGNLERQHFDLENSGNSKAESKMVELVYKTILRDGLTIEARHVYIDEETLPDFDFENSIILVCVDNHPTRRIIGDYLDKNVNNFYLVSGGNGLETGNVIFVSKKNGQKLTHSLTENHVDIRNATEKPPHQMSCEEIVKSAPQIYFANLTVSILMCWYFRAILENLEIIFKNPEIHFDINRLKTRASLINYP